MRREFRQLVAEGLGHLDSRFVLARSGGRRLLPQLQGEDADFGVLLQMAFAVRLGAPVDQIEQERKAAAELEAESAGVADVEDPVYLSTQVGRIPEKRIIDP